MLRAQNDKRTPSLPSSPAATAKRHGTFCVAVVSAPRHRQPSTICRYAMTWDKGIPRGTHRARPQRCTPIHERMVHSRWETLIMRSRTDDWSTRLATRYTRIDIFTDLSSLVVTSFVFWVQDVHGCWAVRLCQLRKTSSDVASRHPTFGCLRSGTLYIHIYIVHTSIHRGYRHTVTVKVNHSNKGRRPPRRRRRRLACRNQIG